MSDFGEFEIGVVQCNKKLQHQAMHPANKDTHNGLQSLNSSFKDLQHRYKQLKEDCVKKIEVSVNFMQRSVPLGFLRIQML